MLSEHECYYNTYYYLNHVLRRATCAERARVSLYLLLLKAPRLVRQQVFGENDPADLRENAGALASPLENSSTTI